MLFRICCSAEHFMLLNIRVMWSGMSSYGTAVPLNTIHSFHQHRSTRLSCYLRGRWLINSRHLRIFATFLFLPKERSCHQTSLCAMPSPAVDLRYNVIFHGRNHNTIWNSVIGTTMSSCRGEYETSQTVCFKYTLQVPNLVFISHQDIKSPVSREPIRQL